MSRHKMYTIKDIVKEKKEWCEKFDETPYDYWRKRWYFLCERLNNYADMERSMKYKRYNAPKPEEKDENVQATSN